MKKYFTFAAIFSLVMLIGCASPAKQVSRDNDKATKEPKQESSAYVIELGFFDCDHMVAAPIAEAVGIFDELGLKVNVTMTAQIPTAMAAGQMDVGYSHTTGLQYGVKGGSPITAVANNHRGGSYYLVGSNKFTDASQLVGKKIAIPPEAHHVNPLWVMMADKTGIPAEVDAYESFSMSQRDSYFAMKLGELDGILVCDPWGSMAEFEGKGNILITHDYLPDGSWGTCCMLLMNKNFMEKYPDLAAKMVLAHVYAIKHIYLHPLEAGRIFAEVFNVPEEVGLMTIYKKTVMEGRTLLWDIDDSAVEGFFQAAKDLGMRDFQDNLPVEELVDHSLLQKINESGTFEDFIAEYVDPVFPVGMSYDDWKRAAVLRAAGEI